VCLVIVYIQSCNSGDCSGASMWINTASAHRLLKFHTTRAPRSARRKNSARSCTLGAAVVGHLRQSPSAVVLFSHLQQHESRNSRLLRSAGGASCTTVYNAVPTRRVPFQRHESRVAAHARAPDQVDGRGRTSVCTACHTGYLSGHVMLSVVSRGGGGSLF
jgi:hypothetical protein